MFWEQFLSPHWITRHRQHGQKQLSNWRTVCTY